MPDLLLEPVPNDVAARFVREKAPVLRGTFDKMLPEIKARAICVSGMQDVDAVQRVRDTLAKLPEGASWEETKQGVMQELEPWMVTADDPEKRDAQLEAADARAELLMRTHGFQAYSYGRYQAQFNPMSASGYLKYVTQEDDRVRPEHAALDGIILPRNDPFWQTHYPPWDWGCRCLAVAMEDEEVEGIAADEEAKGVPADRRSVLGPEQRAMLSGGSSRIVRDGRSLDVSRPQGDKAFAWTPKAMDVPLDQVMTKYDDETKRAFSQAMQKAKIPELDPSTGQRQTVWDYMGGSMRRADAQEALRAGSNERAIVRDYDTTDELEPADGSRTSVNIADALRQAGTEGIRISVTHNHPNGNPVPSPRDVAVLITHPDTLVDITAVARDARGVETRTRLSHGEELSDEGRKNLLKMLSPLQKSDGTLTVFPEKWYDLLNWFVKVGHVRYGIQA